MNGTMVRNDITISLISCQSETSTVFHIKETVCLDYEAKATFTKEIFFFLLTKHEFTSFDVIRWKR